MAKAIDITGQKFYHLTVIERAGSIQNRSTWKCKCDCGNEIIVIGTDLKRGRKKDCGCIAKQNTIQGQKFGKLTALYPTNKRTVDGCIMWHCKCDCGNELDVKSAHLKSGNTSSCGCTRIQKLIEYNHTRAIDLTNQKFGKLTALYPTNKRTEQKSIIWHCRCECGNECEVPQKDLSSGNTKSCGCMRNQSYGELKIQTLLMDANIKFIREYTPLNWNNSTFKPRFDFYIPDKNYLIEYDGIQHYIQGTEHYDNEEKFEITQQHDKIKNQWCKENNIILIRIPYTHYANLTLRDLIPEKSDFCIF